jgi:alpha-L-rhamnosidase
VPTDCPQIERKGYTGDGQLLCELGMRLFNAKRLYKKWIHDICDAQDRKSGFVQYTAPCFVGCAGGPGGWSVAIINVPYAYYKAYGDVEILKECYPYMKKYVSFMSANAPRGLVSYKNRECLGDWNAPWREQIPSRFANTCMFVEALYSLQKVAKLTDNEGDIVAYAKEIERLKTAIDKAYFDEETGDYCFGEQAANAFALKIGLGDERTKNNLVARYQELKKFDTGIFGTKYLAETLCRIGEGDLLVDLINSDDFASYKTWKKQGATTLQEAWKYGRSHNHPMFGTPVLNYFEYILGIRQTEDSTAFKKVVINPLKISALTKVSGKIVTESGEISVSYQDKEQVRRFVICIPQGVEAKFVYEGQKRTLAAGRNEFIV